MDTIHAFPRAPRRSQASQPAGRKIVAQCVSTGRATVPPQPRNGAEEAVRWSFFRPVPGLANAARLLPTALRRGLRSVALRALRAVSFSACRYAGQAGSHREGTPTTLRPTRVWRISCAATACPAILVGMALLDATAITKSFAGVQALRGVSFSLGSGEVHALLGENGAGKSTLIKVITGAEKPDSGTLTVDGRPVLHNTPAAARALGIAAVYQQPALFPELTVEENIALALESASLWRRIDWRARRRQARELLERAGADIEPQRTVGTLSMPEQQLVEIAKAIGARARILILDEPTASLTDREVERLFRVIG